MPGGLAKDGSDSKWTRMYFSDDMSSLNVRREHLAHVFHYKVNVHEMKRRSRELARPLDLLDVGCGEANTLRMFYTADQSRKRDVVNSYTGVDGDPAVIERTRKRAGSVLEGCNATVRVCDITSKKLPVEDASIDLVFCNEVLEHIPRAAGPKVLRKIRRSLRPTGMVLFSTPNKDGTNDRLPADHVYEYGYEEIQEEFAKADLQVVDCLGVYVQQAKLKRYLKDNYGPEMVAAAEDIWSRYGLDLGSIMTADLARPVCNNLLWKLEPM